MFTRNRITSATLTALVWVGLSSPVNGGTLGKTTVGSTNYPMSLQGRLALEPPDASVICSAVLDQQVFLGTTAGRVVQVDLNSLTRMKSIDAGMVSSRNITGCAAEGGSIYFTTTMIGVPNLVQITKVDLQSLAVVAQEEIGIGSTVVGSTSAVDGFLILGANGLPGAIFRVDTATLDSIDELTLESGEIVEGCLLIADGFGYFGTYRATTDSGQIVKVDLSTLTRVGAIDVEDGDGVPGAGVAADGFGYFQFAIGQFLRVVKVDLEQLTRVATVEWDAGVNYYALAGRRGSSVVSGGVGMFGFGLGALSNFPSSGAVLRVDLSNFSVLETYFTGGSASPEWASVSGSSVYFGTAAVGLPWGYAGTIIRLDAGTFLPTARMSLSPGEDSLSCAFRVGDQAYFGGSKVFGHIVQVDLRTFTRVRSLDLDLDLFGSLLRSAVEADGFGYFGTDDGKVVKVDLATLSKVDVLQLGINEIALASGVATGGFAYFGSGGRMLPPEDGIPQQARPKIVKVDLGTFTRVGAIDVFQAGGEIKSSVILGNFAYFGFDRGPIVRLDLRSFTHEILGLERGETLIPGAVAAGNFVYFVGKNRLGAFQLLKIDAQRFRRVGALVLKPEEGTLSGSIVTDGRSAFLGTNGAGRIIRIDLRSMQRTGALNLPNDLDLRTAVTDGVAAYFGAGSSSFGSPGEGRLLKAALGTPNGMIHATRAILREAATPRSINFYAHEAGGTIRLAIYDSAKHLVWQSAPVRVRRANSVLSVPVSSGTPARLRLRPGTYYLAWQLNSNRAVPSYKRGANGSGWSLQQPFGPFPAQVTGEISNRDTWTEFVSY